MGIWILDIGFTRIRLDICRILDTQYPILWDWVWDWVLKFNINWVLGNPDRYRILPEYPIYYLKYFLN